ncbi:UDP-2,4-diacetamido-2,4,6-trideoxy-beta-L-altropyranose hydrolase [Aquimarina sp. W85]|uniref:UDP-2,4-diacetamido-2,4, 6-trideoxy-beta-L-altropyranose hydrolase n=1 Tax=Aquimarina rhodophyticola TaxID=3342246 RepID=UPI00366F5E63
MEKKILFRADGNETIGLGHMYRLFALVEMLGNTYQYSYLTHASSTIEVIPEGCPIQVIPQEINIDEEPKWLAEHYNAKEYIIIADGYQFSTSYQKSIKMLDFSLVYIDDLAKEHMFADIVINHSPSITISDFDSEDYSKFLLGTKFALLRPSFLEAAKQNRIVKKIDRAFVCFGGSDKFNLSLKATKALLSIAQIKEIHVVLGAAYSEKEIYKLRENYLGKLHIYSNLSERQLLKLMISCNFAIAPASTICYELCSVKMPILSGFYVDNQKNIYKELVKKSVVIDGGDFSKYEIEDFQSKIKDVLDITTNSLTSFLYEQKQLFDGKSDVRILGAVNGLNLSFRQACEDDMMRIYDWSNDEIVRHNSYQSNFIKLEDHKNWFLKKIFDKNTLFLVGMVNDIPAGIIRYEIKNDDASVGVLISKEFRGQKLAGSFLKKSADLYFKEYEKPILAYIKVDNLASVKSFENAGYIYFKEEIISGHDSLVYKLEKRDVFK